MQSIISALIQKIKKNDNQTKITMNNYIEIANDKKLNNDIEN